MAYRAIKPDLAEIFSRLSEIPLLSIIRSEALKKLTELGRESLDSHACTLTVVDLENKWLKIEACTGFDEDFENLMTGKGIAIGSLEDGFFIDYDLIARGELVEKYNLQRDGQGVANPKIAQRYNLNSVLSYPLKSDDRLIGYFNHFSSRSDRFTETEKKLLEIFARQAMVTFDYHRTLDLSTSILNDLSQSLLSTSLDAFLTTVSTKACELLSVPVCVVWRLDEEHNKLKIVAATDNVDDDYRTIELDFNDPGIKEHLLIKKVKYLLDVTRPNPNYGHSEAAEAREWVSLLSAPMWGGERLIGMLDVYTKKTRHFKRWEKKFFGAFANHAALSIQKADLLRETQENLTARKRLEKLSEIMQAMTETRNVDELLPLILDRSLEMVGAERGWISQLNFKTGRLHMLAHRGEPSRFRPLKLGEGITGRALQNEEPIRVDDVRSIEWQGVYEEFWKDTRSELAVPIIIRNAEVRIGREVELKSKPMGVLNIESPKIGAFSKADEDCLWSLARHAAITSERLEFDRKLTDLRRVEREIVGERDYDRIIQIVLKGITNTLGFERVNISLVIPESNCIRTEYVKGISKHDVDTFKSMAVHSLDSNDIQADIVKSKKIEVPALDDRRFDKGIFKRFGHDRLIRVFIPMIVSSDDRVIGTVEAGYHRSYRKFIYERDVQILKGFVDYAVQALEQKKSGLLDRISHEFRAPIVGIRSNANFLQRRITELSPALVDSKFNDILMDCEILLYQVGELEHILGRPSPLSKRERTLVYRDIIIKTINQIKPLVAEHGFASQKIIYNPGDSARVIIYVDKAKLNQVVYNLLINSIKYAESDSEKFTIRIEVDESSESYIIKFKDWGIGIKEGLEEKVFENGFRTAEAINKNVNGSGLGLTIARKIVREIGGDLRLARNHKPTEFHMALPKSLRAC